MTTPQQNNRNGDTTPTLITLLERSFKSYEEVVRKYEELLKESSALTALIKDKIEKLATLEQLLSSVANLGDDVEKVINDKMDEFEQTNSEQITTISNNAETSKKDLAETVQKLTTRLNFILACLVIGSTIGGFALLYVKDVIETAKTQMRQQRIVDAQQDPNFKPGDQPYWVDSRGVRHNIFFDSSSTYQVNPDKNVSK